MSIKLASKLSALRGRTFVQNELYEPNNHASQLPVDDSHHLGCAYFPSSGPPKAVADIGGVEIYLLPWCSEPKTRHTGDNPLLALGVQFINDKHCIMDQKSRQIRSTCAAAFICARVVEIRQKRQQLYLVEPVVSRTFLILKSLSHSETHQSSAHPPTFS